MIEKQSVSNTLYIPLLGNIYTSKYFKELLYDKKALSLEKDVLKDLPDTLHEEYFYLASASRYYNMDVEIKSFIKKYPKCNIINLGAGLDTTYYRIKSDTAIFYELDLKDVIDERKKLIQEQENDIYIEGSFLNVDEWIRDIKDKNLPTLLIASGLFHYFKFQEIEMFLKRVKCRFTLLELVFDCCSKRALSISNRYVKKMGNDNAKMYFYINNVDTYLKQLDLDIGLVEEYGMYKYARKILKNISFKTRLSMVFSDFFKMVKILHVKIN